VYFCSAVEGRHFFDHALLVLASQYRNLEILILRWNEESWDQRDKVQFSDAYVEDYSRPTTFFHLSKLVLDFRSWRDFDIHRTQSGWRNPPRFMHFPQLQELSVSAITPEDIILALGCFAPVTVKTLTLAFALRYAYPSSLGLYRNHFWEENNRAEIAETLNGFKPEVLEVRQPVTGNLYPATYTFLNYVDCTSLLRLAINMAEDKLLAITSKRSIALYDQDFVSLNAPSLTDLTITGLPQRRTSNYIGKVVAANLKNVTIDFLIPSDEVLAGTGRDDPDQHPAVQHPVPSVRNLKLIFSTERVIPSPSFLFRLFPNVGCLELGSKRDPDARKPIGVDVGEQCKKVYSSLSSLSNEHPLPNLSRLKVSLVGTFSVESASERILKDDLKRLLETRAIRTGRRSIDMDIQKFKLEIERSAYDDANCGEVLEVGATASFWAEECSYGGAC